MIDPSHRELRASPVEALQASSSNIYAIIDEFEHVWGRQRTHRKQAVPQSLRKVSFSEQIEVTAWIQEGHEQIAFCCHSGKIKSKLRTLWHIDGQICEWKDFKACIEFWRRENTHGDSSSSDACTVPISTRQEVMRVETKERREADKHTPGELPDFRQLVSALASLQHSQPKHVQTWFLAEGRFQFP